MVEQGVKFLKKRDFLSYVALCLDRREPLNIGEAVDILKDRFCLPNKTALSIVRKLVKRSLLVKVGDLEYRCVDPLVYLRGLVEKYSAVRRGRSKMAC